MACEILQGEHNNTTYPDETSDLTPNTTTTVPLILLQAISSLTCAFGAYITHTVEHLALACAAYLVVCAVLYVCVVYLRWFSMSRDLPARPKRVLFVIAHPDDECMFFGPSVVHFTSRMGGEGEGRGSEVYVMCLSTGRNYGMGSTRKAELYASCHQLGVPACNVLIRQHSLMPDAMDATWPEELVARMVLDTVSQYDVDTLITFDRHGVSRHVNHRSVYAGVAHLVLEKKLPNSCRVYLLETVNLLRKYWYTFDLPFSYMLSRYRYILQRPLTRKPIIAMREHKSQLVWFRRLYVNFSRYMIINTLQEMTVFDAQLEADLDDD